MTSVAPAGERIYLGMDVSRDKIAVAVLRPGQDVPAVEVISHDGEMVRRLIGKFADRSVLAACYEAGPGGYELHRLLASAGVACDCGRVGADPEGGGRPGQDRPVRNLLAFPQVTGSVDLFPEGGYLSRVLRTRPPRT